MTWWEYGNWPASPDWFMGTRGESPYDRLDFHVDLGCGKVPKARIGIDRYPAPGVAVVAELDTPTGPVVHQQPFAPHGRQPHPVEPSCGLPFPDSSIESIISFHCLEHIGEGFMALMDEVYRVLRPGGIFRAITPLFPSTTAVEDPDHCRYFMDGTWGALCGDPKNCWLESFSVPYSTARFHLLDKQATPRHADPAEWWGPNDQREIRVALKAMK